VNQLFLVNHHDHAQFSCITIFLSPTQPLKSPNDMNKKNSIQQTSKISNNKPRFQYNIWNTRLQNVSQLSIIIFDLAMWSKWSISLVMNFQVPSSNIISKFQIWMYSQSMSFWDTSCFGFSNDLTYYEKTISFSLCNLNI
jgi:hypothetical protein